MFTGERFVVDLDGHDYNSDNDNDNTHENPPAEPSAPFASLGVIGEIRERQPTTTPPPPKPPSGATGFPQHKQRTKARQSAFKQRRDQNQKQSSSSTPPPPQPPRPTNGTTRGVTLEDEKKQIDEQNRMQLGFWSESKLQEERAELMESMGSSLLERFLRRATIDDDVPSSSSKSNLDTTREDTDQQQHEQRQQGQEQKQKQQTGEPSKLPKKSVSFNVPNQPPPPPTPFDDLPPTHPPEDLHPASQPTTSVPFHFPKPPPRQTPIPNLDPSSPSFLSDLQSHYFPDLPHDPSSISWLQPPPSDPSDPESSLSAYHPSSTVDSVAPSAIRFSLLGSMLSPSTSLSLPTSLGLHHHGHDPHAAGYTIPELAILGRSSFPAQRCIAWQVLGRILFRLGKGQFGERGSTLVEGLWTAVEQEGVVARMLSEADGGGMASALGGDGGGEFGGSGGGGGGGGGRGGGGLGKHASANAYAVEGVWLWRMGGGGDRGLLKEGTVRSQ